MSAEETQDTGSEDTQRKCMSCGSDSSDRMIIPAEFHKEEGWVCVRCLPQFIHGAH